MRGARPWDQFLNYCDVIAQEEGGRFWAAQLSDPRYEPDIEKKLTELGKGNGRPALQGYTAEIKALDRVANQVRLLIRAMTQSDIGFIEGPEGPVERIEARRKQLSNALVDAAIGCQEVSGDDV